MSNATPLAEASESADVTNELTSRTDAPAEVAHGPLGFGEVRFDALGFVEFAITDLLAV